jgi:hypothetical protein
MVDPVAKLGNTLIEKVVILDGLGQDTSTNIFEFNPPLSTSNEPSQCNNQHPTCLIKVMTLRQAFTNKILEF